MKETKRILPPHFTGDYRRHDRDHQITKFRIHFTFRQNQANNTKSGHIFQKSSIKIHWVYLGHFSKSHFQLGLPKQYKFNIESWYTHCCLLESSPGLPKSWSWTSTCKSSDPTHRSIIIQVLLKFFISCISCVCSGLKLNWRKVVFQEQDWAPLVYPNGQKLSYIVTHNSRVQFVNSSPLGINKNSMC